MSTGIIHSGEYKANYVTPTLGALWKRQDQQQERQDNNEMIGAREAVKELLEFFSCTFSHKGKTIDPEALPMDIWAEFREGLWDSLDPTVPSGNTTDE